MKKYIAMTITIISIMSFILVFSAKGVESYKLNKGYVVTKNSVEDKTTLDQKKEVENIKTNSSRNQESIPVDLNGVIDKYIKKAPVEAINKDSQKTPVDAVNKDSQKTSVEAANKDIQKSSVEATKSKGERKIDVKKPMVALTFDDGPHLKYTMQIQESLKKYNGLATFFVLGSRAEKYKNVIKSLSENGNQIGNHTYDHKRLTKLSNKDITNDLTKTNNILQDITSIKPSLMRPTYGSINNNVKFYSNAPLILWSIDTLDWKTKNEKMIVKEVTENVKDGDIILMHDIYKATAIASETIIRELSSRGYQLVTIDELYAARGIELVSGKVYTNAYIKK